MNELERQIYAATFAVAFENDWRFFAENQGVATAMERTRNGFPYAEVADQAVLAHRAALASEDAQYLLLVTEGKTP
jgi:hypothetical protein